MMFCHPARPWFLLLVTLALASSGPQNTGAAETNLTIRVMAANLTSGNYQSYESPGINLFKGLQPDIVAIQEFRYGASSADAQLRQFVNLAFGPEFVFYREPYTAAGDIPNGIISRWPIIQSGSWDDQDIANRGFAWAQIDLPGTNDLYVVSVHLYSDSAATRNAEAISINNCVAANFPPNAWILVAGDFNTGSRTESAVATFKTFLSDSPVPADQSGDEDTNAGRTQPYDYLLPSFTLQTNLTPVKIGAQSFSRGLVFDSRRYTPLADVSPIQPGDSAFPGMQHMPVLKDFTVSYHTTDQSTAPVILAQPSDCAAAVGSNVTFSVSAAGAPPLKYQWLFAGEPIPGGTLSAHQLTNVQTTNAGRYSVHVSNQYGAVISSDVTLIVGIAPRITASPLDRTVNSGDDVELLGSAEGTSPLAYQWHLSGNPLPGATAPILPLPGVKPAQAGDYTVLVTNLFGSALSAPARLTVNTPAGNTLAQWNFNNTNLWLGTPPPSLGSGTLTLIGGTTAAWAGGTGSVDPLTPNNAWNTTTYPSPTAANKSAGLLCRVSTLGHHNISIRWDQRVSNTGSKYLRLQYSTNGATFIDYPTPIQQNTATVFEPKTNNLAGLPGVDNNPNFALRIVAEFESTAAGTSNHGYIGAGGSYASAGTVRFDILTVSGIAKPSAPDPANLLDPVYDRAFHFTVSGTAGSNYIIQAAPGPAPDNWMSVFTNPAPFTFTDPDAPNHPTRYYRAISAP